MSKSIKIDDDAHRLSKIEAINDGVSQQSWISNLIRAEIKRRQVRNKPLK